jgi:hypothetical protein
MTAIALNDFSLDGVQFIVDLRPGAQRGKSAAGGFVLVKTQEFIEFYRGLAGKNIKTILELGMFEGGSLVLFDKLFKPEKIVGVDIRKQPIEPLEAYCANNPQVLTYYGLSQTDDILSRILAENFPNGIDLIVDDASHLYEFTKRTFEICFPHLRPGGTYVIEDWSWAHKPHRQHAGDPWADKPAMTNLLFELTLLTTCTNWIKSLTIHHDMAIIEKSEASPKVIDAGAYKKLIRGRTLELI